MARYSLGSLVKLFRLYYPEHALVKDIKVNELKRREAGRVILGGFVGLLLVSSGCQSLFKGTMATPPAEGPVMTDARAYTVEVHSNWTKPSTSREMFSGPVPLQKVVEKSGVLSRHRNLEVTVIRVAKDTGKVVRLKAEFDPATRSIKPQYDYDVLANDHVIIKPSNKSPVDDLIKPLNQLTGGGGV